MLKRAEIQQDLVTFEIQGFFIAVTIGFDFLRLLWMSGMKQIQEAWLQLAEPPSNIHCLLQVRSQNRFAFYPLQVACVEERVHSFNTSGV